MDQTTRLNRLRERYMNGGLDRRRFLGLLGCSGLALGFVGGPFGKLVRPALAQMTEIRFDGWGGVVSEALREHAFDPYEQATGNKVVDSTFGGEEEVLTKVRTGQLGDHHIIHSSGLPWYKRWIDADMGVELNLDNIPNAALLSDTLMQRFFSVTPEHLSAIPYDYGSTGIAYNTNHVSEDEAKELGANLLLKPELKGKIGGWADWQTRIWYGALQTDQDPNDIQDMDAVWEKLREHRELLLKYWGSGAELMDLLAKEEIYVTEGWSGRIAALQEQGHPIAYLDPQNSYGWEESMMVLKGSPVAEAEELLNFMLAPDTAIAVAEGQNYPPAHDPQKVEMTDKIKALPAFDPTGKLEHFAFADPAYWTDNESEWKRAWSRIERGA